MPPVAAVIHREKSQFLNLTVPISLLSLPDSLQLPPSPCLPACLFDVSLLRLPVCGVTWRIFPCHPRTPEAICQFQLASCVRRTLVAQSNSPAVVGCTRTTARACSITGCMIDATLQLGQIVRINRAVKKTFKHSSIHERTRLSAFITGGRIAIRTGHTHPRARQPPKYVDIF